MPPKPFPFPLGVGVDIIELSRLKPLLGNHHALNRWAQKIFNRLEWPDLLKVFQRAAQVKDTGTDTTATKSQSQLVLPKIPAENLRLTEKIMEYLAGRWAMKEAAIKAHTYRYHQLSMNQVSVLRWGAKVKILIDPPCATVDMNARVASLRGLKHSRLSRISQVKSNSLKNLTGDSSDGTSVDSGKVYQRTWLIKEEDRQIAEGSISHDGKFAVAMCVALNESREHSDNDSGTITDDGSGDPTHEPIWGDEGFLEIESLEDLRGAALLLSEMKGAGPRSVLFSGIKNSKSSDIKNSEKSMGLNIDSIDD